MEQPQYSRGPCLRRRECSLVWGEAGPQTSVESVSSVSEWQKRVRALMSASEPGMVKYGIKTGSEGHDWALCPGW